MLKANIQQVPPRHQKQLHSTPHGSSPDFAQNAHGEHSAVSLAVVPAFLEHGIICKQRLTKVLLKERGWSQRGFKSERGVILLFKMGNRVWGGIACPYFIKGCAWNFHQFFPSFLFSNSGPATLPCHSEDSSRLSAWLFNSVKFVIRLSDISYSFPQI